MSEDESKPPIDAEIPAPELVPLPRPSRLRRFFLRHLPLTVAGIAVLLAITLVSLYFWASSAAFENYVRRQMVRKLEAATGGRVEIASFHWHLLTLEADAGGVVIHGLEAPGEAPYAQVKDVRAQWSILGWWIPHFPMRDIEILKPQLHLIVYPDGSTNQPQPRRLQKPGKPALDSFFDLKAAHISVEQGVFEYENRAASFDFQDRFIPLDFTASDASLRMTYIPGSTGNPGSPATSLGRLGGNQESYRIEAGVRDLSLSRGASSKTVKASVHGFLQATLDLTPSSATLRSLRVTARGRGIKDHTLDIAGSLDDFAHPRWQAKATGELDLRLLEPITGYPNAPQGLAHLDITGAGGAGSFQLGGSVHVEDASYIGTGVVSTGVTLDARVYADPEQLVISSIVARLRQGGQISGDLTLAHWLPASQPSSPAAKTPNSVKGTGFSPYINPAKSMGALAPDTLHSQPADEITLPVNGKVTAQFKDVALDTLLGMLCDPPFQHLGLDTRVNGPANAHWINGDKYTLSVDALLNLIPPAQAAEGKAITSGLIDATYTHRDGAVDLRKMVLNLPSSQLLAHGHLGAYPMASASALTVDFHTGNLREFDTVLSDLGMSRNGKTGVAALPIVLNGQADFHGTWTGSLIDPHLSGNLQANQLSVEVPAIPGASPGTPQFIPLDSVEARGLYSAARIDITRGLLRRGNAEVVLDGSLTTAAVSAMHGTASAPSFDANALLHLHLRASQVGVDLLRPLTGPNLPVAGMLSAQLQADGPIRALSGSGWVDLDNGSVFGEPVSRIRAQGGIVNQTINLTSVTLSKDAGNTLTATGSYNLQSHLFQLDAQSAGIDLARIDWLRKKGVAATGMMGFAVQGSGTFDDPRLQARATLSGLMLGGESLGSMELQARTTNRTVIYDLSTKLEAAELALHGQTTLTGDYATQAKLDFSRFNIGALLKLAQVQGLSGDSSLVGTATIEGPLAHLSDLRGDARIDQLAATVSGVYLKSEGGAHLTLAQGLLRLDPLHVTGDLTDLRAQGSLSLLGQHEFNLDANGTINLKVAETLDPDLTASGNTTFQLEARGPLMNPRLRGRIDFQNAALSLEDLPNGLSQLHGTLEFNQDRLEVKSLSAMSGGGLLNLTGYLAYQHGLYANLSATGNDIRIRYPQGVSSLADASLHLQGAQNNLLLSGDVLITRFTVSPDLDIAALAQQANAAETISPPGSPSNHVRLDVHITSSPQLNFQNAYAKLAGNVDLRLRGTVASPSLLGRVSITEGSATLAGTRYELQRGDIYFTNPVRIQPSIDLNATARVEDYDITLGLHGSIDKPAITWRSDPPLPEADIVALLALGRTENQQRIYTQQQESAGASTATDALLGGALNATVSSRVQKLFGAGSVKLDPNYLGTLGNSTSRIIVEEQLGSSVTLTYATNVNTTSQQLIQAEVAVNRHISLVVARDESGVFSMVLKATRRYR